MPALLAACAGSPPAPPPPAPDRVSFDNGQRLFGANCARCHGADARGTAAAPDLMARVQGMSQDRFVDVVLRRYAWSVPAGDARSEAFLREAMVQGLLQRRAEPGDMPAWQDEPAVRAGVRDLYLYLDTRARRAPR